MAKQCLRCGTIVDDNTKFCPNCASIEFGFYQKNVQKNNFNQTSAEFYQSPVMPKPAKKIKMKPWGIVFIVCSVFVLGIVGFVIRTALIGNFLNSDLTDVDSGYVDNSAYSDNDGEPKEEVAYSKGFVTDNVYTNEWADMKFSIPVGYFDGTESDYVSDDNIDHGLIIFSGEIGNSFDLTFEKIPYSIITEESYLDACKRNIEKSFSDLAESSQAFNCTINDIYSKRVIAGYEYSVMSINYNTDGIFVYGVFCVRKIGDRMAAIAISDQSEAEIDRLLSLFLNFS